MRHSTRNIAAANSARRRGAARNQITKTSHLSSDHKWSKKFKDFEGSWPFQSGAVVAALIGFAVVVWTLVQIRSDLEFRELERESIKSDRIERLWTRILRRVGGNTGQGEAMTELLKQGGDLNGVTIGCDSDSCPTTIISRFTVIAHNSKRYNLKRDVRLLVKDTIFEKMNLLGANLIVNGDQITFRNSSLRGATIRLLNSNAKIRFDRGHLTKWRGYHPVIRGSGNLSLANTDVSGVVFEGNRHKLKIDMLNVSYDSNNPPVCRMNTDMDGRRGIRVLCNFSGDIYGCGTRKTLRLSGADWHYPGQLQLANNCTRRHGDLNHITIDHEEFEQWHIKHRNTGGPLFPEN